MYWCVLQWTISNYHQSAAHDQYRLAFSFLAIHTSRFSIKIENRTCLLQFGFFAVRKTKKSWCWCSFWIDYSDKNVCATFSCIAGLWRANCTRYIHNLLFFRMYISDQSHYIRLIPHSHNAASIFFTGWKKEQIGCAVPEKTRIQIRPNMRKQPVSALDGI